jgi:hypothetical protein
MAMKVPSQWPVVLLVEVGCTESKTFGSGEGRDMKKGARKVGEHGDSAFVQNLDVDINIGRAANLQNMSQKHQLVEMYAFYESIT